VATAAGCLKKAMVVQKNGNRVCVNNEVKNSKLVERSDVNETRRADIRMTSAEYAGDNPLRLANEIDAALAKYGLGNDHRMCKAIHFFERELRLIAECLRCAGPQKVTRQPPAALADWPHRKKSRNTLSSLKGRKAAA
jgi:hypothetical protein